MAVAVSALALCMALPPMNKTREAAGSLLVEAAAVVRMDCRSFEANMIIAEMMVTPTHGPERPQNAATFLLMLKTDDTSPALHLAGQTPVRHDARGQTNSLRRRPDFPPGQHMNWSHFAHFSWRARVTGVSGLDVPVPDRTSFLVGGNSTVSNGSDWSSFVRFDNASVAKAANGHSNQVLLNLWNNYSRDTGDTFDFLILGLAVGGPIGVGPAPPGPAPPPPPELLPAPHLTMELCNGSDLRQQWTFGPAGVLSPRSEPGSSVTHDPLDPSIIKQPGVRLRSAADSMDIPLKYKTFKYDATRHVVSSTILTPPACMDVGTRSTGPNPTVGRLDAVCSPTVLQSTVCAPSSCQLM